MMHYLETAPDPSLSRYIECFWFLSGDTPAAMPVERVLPDGRNEIVLNLADPFTRVHADGSLEAHPVTLLVGQISEAVTLRPGPRVDLVGVRFFPGGLYPFLGVSMVETTNHLGPLQHASASLAADLAERLHDARTHEARAEVLNAHFGPRLPAWTREQALVEVAVGQILVSDGRVTMDGLTAVSAVGARQLERIFRWRVGLPPKLLARIVRFQNVFRQIQQPPRSYDPPILWSQVSHVCGYYDQAHLIRDFRQFAGSSPAAYFSGQHEMSDHFTG